MAYLSSRGFTIPTNPLLEEIRTELFDDYYYSLDFAAFQGKVVPCERHQHKSRFLKWLNWLLVNIWNAHFRSESMARRGEEKALELIRLEGQATDATGLISPVQFLTTITHFASDGPDSKHLRIHQDTSLEYLWLSK